MAQEWRKIGARYCARCGSFGGDRYTEAPQIGAIREPLPKKGPQSKTDALSRANTLVNKPLMLKVLAPVATIVATKTARRRRELYEKRGAVSNYHTNMQELNKEIAKQS